MEWGMGLLLENCDIPEDVAAGEGLLSDTVRVPGPVIVFAGGAGDLGFDTVCLMVRCGVLEDLEDAAADLAAAAAESSLSRTSLRPPGFFCETVCHENEEGDSACVVEVLGLVLADCWRCCIRLRSFCDI